VQQLGWDASTAMVLTQLNGDLFSLKLNSGELKFRLDNKWDTNCEIQEQSSPEAGEIIQLPRDTIQYGFSTKLIL
jgi:hypothetical protein